MRVSNGIFGKRQAIEQARSSVFIAMVLASIVFSFALVTIKFLWDLGAYNRRVINQKNAAKSALEQNVASVDNLQSGFAKLEAGKVNSQTVLDALPSKYDFPALATSIEALTIRSGLTLESFNGEDLTATAVDAEPQPAPVEMPFSISVKGPYKQVKEFIDILNRSIRPMRIDSINMGGNDENMKVELDITTFYQPAVDLNLQTRVVR